MRVPLRHAPTTCGHIHFADNPVDNQKVTVRAFALYDTADVNDRALFASEHWGKRSHLLLQPYTQALAVHCAYWVDVNSASYS